MTDYSAELRAMGERLIVIADDLADDIPPDPGPEPPEPTPGEFSMVVNANKLTMVNGQTMVLDNDHIGMWGQPGEAVTLKIITDKAMKVEVALDYALAAESQEVGSTRKVSVGTANKQLSLAVTEDLWAEKSREWTSRASFDLPKGESVVKIENDTTTAWSNWADLYAVGLTSTDGTFSVVGVDVDPGPPPNPNPDPTPTPPPMPGNYDVVVGTHGTLQQLVDRAEALQGEWKIGVPSGVWNGRLYMVNKPFKKLQIFLEEGAVIRGTSGIEGYGQIENFRVTTTAARKAFIEAAGNDVFGEGIFIDSTRGDKGANGMSAGNIVIENIVVRPISGTGIIQRNGVGIWGADKVEVVGCEIHHAAGNAIFGYNTAGSLISIGHSITNTRVPAKPYACRLENNKLYNAEITDGQDSADRNGIILDLYHGDHGGAYGDRAHGPVLIKGNDIKDVAGRGIQVLIAGEADSPVTVDSNKVSGRYAYGLGNDPHQGNPKVAIGGYGAGFSRGPTVTNNTVDTSQGAGKAAYGWEGFSTPATGSGNTP